MNRTIVALPLLFALAACGGGADEPPTDLESAQSDGAAEALARNFEAGDFLDLQLGAKIVGPQGEDVESALANAEGNFADLRSFVACPAGMDPCDPATAPQGTIYTYVHVVYPGEDNEAGSGSGESNDSSDVERATAFRMTRPATGFTGAVGYSKDEAMAAIGAKDGPKILSVPQMEQLFVKIQFQDAAWHSCAICIAKLRKVQAHPFDIEFLIHPETQRTRLRFASRACEKWDLHC